MSSPNGSPPVAKKHKTAKSSINSTLKTTRETNKRARTSSSNNGHGPAPEPSPQIGATTATTPSAIVSSSRPAGSSSTVTSNGHGLPLPNNNILVPGRNIKPKLIAVYNCKGGIAKSTLSINLAAALADRLDDGNMDIPGKKAKVLLVEADPQCNLQQFFYPSDDANVLNNDNGNQRRNANIQHNHNEALGDAVALHAVASPAISAHHAVNLEQLLNPAFGLDSLESPQHLLVPIERKPRLTLLPGSVHLVTKEALIANAGNTFIKVDLIFYIFRAFCS